MPSPSEDNSANRHLSHPPHRYRLAVWLTVALSIPLLSAFGRTLQQWTYQHLGGTGITWIIGLQLIGLGAGSVGWLASRPLGEKRYTLLIVSALLALAFVTITALLPRTEERLHFVTFGLFGFFSRRLLPTSLAVLAILAWSGGDELFQNWLPDRVGDWRDVGMNIVAGAIGMGLAWLGTLRKPSTRTSKGGL